MKIETEPCTDTWLVSEVRTAGWPARLVERRVVHLPTGTMATAERDPATDRIETVESLRARVMQLLTTPA